MAAMAMAAMAAMAMAAMAMAAMAAGAARGFDLPNEGCRGLHCSRHCRRVCNRSSTPCRRSRIVDRGAALRAGAVEHVHIAVVGGGVIQRRSLRLRACGHRALALVPVERELELICVMRRQARHSLAEDAETPRPGTPQTRHHSVGAAIMWVDPARIALHSRQDFCLDLRAV